uniref:zinc transporter 7-like isoform X1 n=1 Tax=Styela clava TaxID=7725 RepID=UPI00193A05FC|nr:zinc transporter 7-like isoform X1 [Styela clava]
MLPMTNKDGEFKPEIKAWGKIKGWIRNIIKDPNSRNLLFFLLLNLSFAFVELFWGIWSNSLGLISDSFHMFFDCTALLAGLAASVVSKWKANERFSYGYVRAEVLAGFINALFLLFISFFIFSESIERLVEPPEVKHERLLLVSVLGFFVNMVGIFVFHGHGHHGHSHGGHDHGHGHSHGGHSHGGHNHGHGHDHDHGHDHSHSHGHDHDHSHAHDHSHDHGHGHGDHHGHSHGHVHHDHSPEASQHQILHSVFLHIMADTLGSVGVIVSALLVKYFDLMIADPICSMMIAILIAVSVFPLLQESVGILMQRTPLSLDHQLPGCYQKVMQLEGVYRINEPHFWTLCSEVFVGTIKIQIAPNANPRYIMSQAHSIFAQIGVRQLYCQIDFTSV